MPVEFKIDNQRKLIIGRGYGEITHTQLKSVVQDMVKSEDYSPTLNEIWDIREASKVMTFFDQTIERVETEQATRGIHTPNREAIIVANSLHSMVLPINM